MDESTSREKVLKKVRNAYTYKADNPIADVDLNAPVFKANKESLDVAFAEQFIKISGKFVYCETLDEFAASLKSLVNDRNWDQVFCPDDSLWAVLSKGGISYEHREEHLQEAVIGLTRCEYLIARFGSIMVSSRLISGRRMCVFPEVHIVLAFSSQLVEDLPEALAGIREKYETGMPSLISVISGPSRTADIEKTLVMGAHGPKELYVFLVDDSH